MSRLQKKIQKLAKDYLAYCETAGEPKKVICKCGHVDLEPAAIKPTFEGFLRWLGTEQGR